MSGLTDEDLLTLAARPKVCRYPEHARRIAASGIGSAPIEHHRKHYGDSFREDGQCPEHGCPLCRLRDCQLCQELQLALDEIEWPAATVDPWCIRHGVPDPSRLNGCRLCWLLVRGAQERGWQGPTGHKGVDCLHCTVCGECYASGRVCRSCWRCLDHLEEDPDGRPSGFLEPPVGLGDCERERWDPVLSRTSGDPWDVYTYFYEHELWDTTTRLWGDAA